MMSRMGFTGDGITPTQKKPERRTHSKSRGAIAATILALSAIALFAVTLVPVETGSAQPSRESDCTICHDTIVETLLTVSGLPAEYTPSATYTITVQVDDLNGANGENGFYLTVDAGTLSNPGSNVEVNTATTASTVDTRPRAESSWTVDWIAPASGTVNIHVYAVSATDSLTGSSAPGDEDLITLSASGAIPEFHVLLLPIVGIVGVVLIATRVTRRSK